MSELLKLCKKQFGTKDLYAVLQVEKSATANELRKGYHKVSLQVHPDRCSGEDKEDSTKRFQTISRVYQLLSDADLRAVYDETGEIDEERGVGECKDWVKYWRLLFKQVTEQDIIDFEKKYVGSEEELEDLKLAYVEGEGSIQHVLDSVLLCTVEDEARFRVIIDAWIQDGTVDEYPAYVGDTEKKKKRRKRKATREASEAAAAREELGLGAGSGDLQAMIQARGKARAEEADAFLDALANKYAKPVKKAGRNKSKK